MENSNLVCIQKQKGVYQNLSAAEPEPDHLLVLGCSPALSVQTSYCQDLNTKKPSSHDFPAINRLSKNCCIYSSHRPTDNEGMWSLSSFLPHSRVRLTSLISLVREELCCELLWFWPLCHWNLGVIFPGQDWLGSVTALCNCQASKVNERPPWSSLEINLSQNITGPGQIWEGDGIYGMACQVGISVSLYKSEASSVTYLSST